ncbi:uncharacterized protein LOC107428382 isoform X3 [Ziziphus jujuba]|uniref:Uncharacterized protein LOC107428382 isoform X3 n=1 Tax=Ziziphus jujuba TaxID=326968 RepID=A0ABM3I187_ZIZJJ|nr:uncharacterized protein LOC107428382 isoform X3 [Ziziphus jujuba]
MASRDASGFKLLFGLAVMYGLMSMLVYCVIQMKFIKPLEMDAPLDRFSEARAIEHVRILAKEIGGRQEGRPGLKEAARYIIRQLEMMKKRAGSNTRIEIQETFVNGSFNMMFLGHSISLAYRNHINVLMRVSSVDSQISDPSVLMNAHFDSTLGSPGAGDCGSCVASLLEIGRLVVDSGWVPPRPIIFLFNGAEELFMLGAHGFMKTHEWRETIGAFINVEASGTGGPDLVCQSGPGQWPSKVYAQSAIYPMAHSAAQDVFPVIPGDTDYRMFSEDYGSIPGLDIIFLFGGYFYHTSHDTVERLLPGSIQARGENLFSILKAFTNSSQLTNAHEKKFVKANANLHEGERAVFFDYLTFFMVYYSRRVALILHNIPLAIFLAMPLFLYLRSSGLRSWFAVSWDFMKGMLFHATGVILAILFPIIFSILRLLFTSQAMNWFAHPYLAFLMFIPPALIGLLIPRAVCGCFPLSQDASVLKTSTEALSDEARFWGAYGLYASMTSAYLVAGLSGGFLTFMLSAYMLLAWILFCLSVKSCGHQLLSIAPPRTAVFYVIAQIPSLAYSVYFGGFLVQFLIEKMGMMGTIPPPYDSNRIVDSSYDISVLDSNSLSFLFKYAPQVAKELHLSPDFSFETARLSRHETWMGLFPVSLLFARGLKLPAKSDEMLKQYKHFPNLSTYEPHIIYSGETRRVHLELSLGSLEEIWVAVLNITGPLSSWSFADNMLPAPETYKGGPPSYISRLSGAGNESWNFWLEVNSDEELRVDVAVVDQYLVDEAKKLTGLLPEWADVIAYSSFLSSYVF